MNRRIATFLALLAIASALTVPAMAAPPGGRVWGRRALLGADAAQYGGSTNPWVFWRSAVDPSDLVANVERPDVPRSRAPGDGPWNVVNALIGNRAAPGGK